MNNQFTDEQLDQIDTSKLHFRHMLTDRIEQELQKMGKFFSKNLGKDYCQPVASKLVDSGYRFKAIKSGLNAIIESRDSFPSYSELIASMRPFCAKLEVQKKEDIEFEKEEIEVERLRGELIKAAGEEAPQKLLEWWLRKVMKLPKDEFFQAYMKCALFDWRDAGMSNNFEKILTIGLGKLEKIKNLKETNRL
jgi:hypothetical protein